MFFARSFFGGLVFMMCATAVRLPHARRLQVEIDYAIELELQQDDLSSLLADDNANMSEVENSLSLALDAGLHNAAEQMSSGDFSTQLAESVNEPLAPAYSRGPLCACSCRDDYVGNYCQMAPAYQVSGVSMSEFDGIYSRMDTSHLCNGKPLYENVDSNLIRSLLRHPVC